MDGLLATILGGLVVTVIGAILAFYFGSVRERQKQEYERQQEEQRRLEERQEAEQSREAERQEELNERRTEALVEMRSRVGSVAEGLRSLAESLVGFRARMPSVVSTLTDWKWYHDEYKELAQQRDALGNEMASLRAYYEKRAASLETTTTTHDLFASFDREFERRYTPLSRHLYTDRTRQRHRFLSEYTEGKKGVMTATASIMSLGLYTVAASRENKNALQDEFSNVAADLESIQNWSFEAHEAAFDKEAKRVAGDLP
jgi:vacuolar-type H+-ATPase subunit I/STV1